jgi:hypothetical protein
MDFFKSLHEQNGGPNCCRCGQPTTLATVLPRFGETPAYDIFQCNVCNAVQRGSPKDRRRRRIGRLSWRPHYFRADARAPLPAALVRRGIGHLLGRARRNWSGAELSAR